MSLTPPERLELLDLAERANERILADIEAGARGERLPVDDSPLDEELEAERWERAGRALRAYDRAGYRRLADIVGVFAALAARDQN